MKNSVDKVTVTEFHRLSENITFFVDSVPKDSVVDGF